MLHFSHDEAIRWEKKKKKKKKMKRKRRRKKKKEKNENRCALIDCLLRSIS